MAKASKKAVASKKKRPAKEMGKQREIPALRAKQSDSDFYLFTMAASELWDIVQINRRSEDKQEGYQRALSPSRVRGIAKFIQGGGLIPGAIVVSFDDGEFDEKHSKLLLPSGQDIGWVIDGQHRLAGAHEAAKLGVDVQLPVVGLLNCKIEQQIALFITINREARGVPASLYIDLLKDLPRQKTDREITDERIADIGRRINADESSPFFQRIIFTRNARAGEISLVNFARVLRPHIVRQSGVLGLYTQPEQEGAINNYYKGLETAFPKAFNKELFFRTIGFGGVWRAFPLILNLAQSQYKAFSVSAIAKIFSEVSDFDFESWTELGTGTAAETQAGDDLIQAIQDAFAEGDSSSMILKLD